MSPWSILVFNASDSQRISRFTKNNATTVTSVGENIWVFEQRTLTGSESFSLSICLDSCLDDTKFVFPSVLTLIETIYPKICSRAKPKSAKSPLPVDVRRSKTSLLKLPLFRQLKASRPIAERQIEHTGSRLVPFFLSFFLLSVFLSFFLFFILPRQRNRRMMKPFWVWNLFRL